jgi:8-oxo-dGTP pyrophosphatase MutT (NUDIX family)
VRGHHAYLPDLSRLHFITRAITPPGFPRRFDARFFAADTDAIGHRIDNVVHDEAELVKLAWVPIAEAQTMDLPMITHTVLDELQDRIAAGLNRDLPVPFYRMQGSYFERGLL